ncbi:hypothetical protein QYM36_004271 [Artemia franciscana]|uniref:Uncharacterized protein n=2 Tax=Artemia franciscana TaxID=6661 RepID=A0AA88LCF8_ARTSF|nr:hypothetical protein QYM36_004271 [Artemia franciscana]KAK2720327.1 hypothetical protein QYM36_004271 [Artemia franciscana]
MDSKRNVVSVIAQTFAVLAFLLGAVSIAAPYWGAWSGGGDAGYFGLWDVCSNNYLLGDASCRAGAAQYRLSSWTRIGGGIASGGLTSCALSMFLGIPILLMLRRKNRFCVPFKPAVTFRLVFSSLSALLSAAGAALFAIQPQDGYLVEFTWAFYSQVIVIVLEILLTVASAYEFIFSRQQGGDPTDYERDPHGLNAMTLSNPSFRDESDGRRLAGRSPSSSGPGRPGQRSGHVRSNSLNRSHRAQNGAIRNSRKGKGLPPLNIAVTDSSAKPYVSMSPNTPSGESSLNGSVDSDSVAGSVLSSASVGSLTKSPLRSSLKKPRQNGLGIANPAFAGSSPSITSRGSVKKVKIVIEQESTPV